MVKRKRGSVIADINGADNDLEDIYDMEDQEAVEDLDLSREATDDLEIADIAADVALTHTVSAADSRTGIESISKVCD
jgi:hypothetical protein